jgi:hypothetical protein
MNEMADITFKIQEIDKLNDNIRNCLRDVDGRKGRKLLRILRYYYTNILKDDNMSKTFELLMKAHRGQTFDLNDLDGFNITSENTFRTLADNDQKIDYVKQQCCQILGRVHHRFIHYLRTEHRPKRFKLLRKLRSKVG